MVTEGPRLSWSARIAAALAGGNVLVGCLQIIGSTDGKLLVQGPCVDASDCADGGGDAGGGDDGDGAFDAAAAPDGDATAGDGPSNEMGESGGDDVAEAGDRRSDGETDAPAGADALAGDAEAMAPCEAGGLRCDETGQFVQSCGANGWSTLETCPAFCSAGACITPPSCGGTYRSGCGPAGSDNCCAARAVPGGTFFRSYDGVTQPGTQYGMMYPATVSTFTMDVYEVTVDRFTNFVNAYDQWSKPAPGSGKNSNNPGDTGWDPSWATHLPSNAAALRTNISCSLGTWTLTSNDSLPITCLDWYTAFAFCIWDGGRLPTEAEWNYAAAGGAEQRVYPWSVPPSNVAISAQNAIYSAGAVAAVGSEPMGAGKWGHLDLAGNALEWTVDSFVDPYASTSCDNCGLFDGSDPVQRGGNYNFPAALVTASFRTDSSAGYISNTDGVRCVRTAPNSD